MCRSYKSAVTFWNRCGLLIPWIEIIKLLVTEFYLGVMIACQNRWFLGLSIQKKKLRILPISSVVVEVIRRFPSVFCHKLGRCLKVISDQKWIYCGRKNLWKLQRPRLRSAPLQAVPGTARWTSEEFLTNSPARKTEPHLAGSLIQFLWSVLTMSIVAKWESWRNLSRETLASKFSSEQRFVQAQLRIKNCNALI